MKQLYAVIGKIIFYLFVLAVFGWTASLTLGEMRAILPNDPITPYFALALFDGGALAWLMAWSGYARGLAQRAISAIMLVVCLLGVVLLSAGRLMDGGQTMVTVSTSLSAAVIYGVIGATLANLTAIYAFHITDPDTMEEIETGLLSDTLRSEAQKQASASIEGQAKELGAILAARATGQLKYNLRLPVSNEEAAQAGNFIDVVAQDIEAQPKKTSVIEQWLKAAVEKLTPSPIQTAQPVKVYQSTATAPAVVEEEKTVYETLKELEKEPIPAEQPEAQAATFSKRKKSFEFTLNAPRWWEGHSFYGMMDKIPAQRYEVRLPDEDNGWGALYNMRGTSIGNLTPAEWGALQAGRLPETWLEKEPPTPAWYKPDTKEEVPPLSQAGE